MAVAYRHVAGIEMRDNQRCDDGRKYRRVSQMVNLRRDERRLCPRFPMGSPELFLLPHDRRDYCRFSEMGSRERAVRRLSETTSSNGPVQVFAVREMSGEEDMTGSWAAYHVLQPERT